MSGPRNIGAQPPAVGKAIELDFDLRLILAPNPSPMTYWGTNTYLLGTKDIAVIDPGPLTDTAHDTSSGADTSSAIDPHLGAILDALAPGQRISHVIVTHSHRDHSPLARVLSDHTGAPIYGFGDAAAGRSAIMQSLARDGLVGGGEGIDRDFRCDILLADNDLITGSDWQLRCIHTPGHIGNHICLALDDRLFSGDHVMGWASSLVSPPDGDLSDFMASCEKLRDRRWRVFYPGHGPMIEQPNERIDWLLAHRRGRESEILGQLAQSPTSLADLTRKIYTDTPSALLPAAERNVFAHLIDLFGRREIDATPQLSQFAEFSRRRS